MVSYEKFLLFHFCLATTSYVYKNMCVCENTLNAKGDIQNLKLFIVNGIQIGVMNFSFIVVVVFIKI